MRNKSWFFLAALLVVATWNYIDRAAFGILQEPIKHEFGLSDFQLGLLGGPAFVILYVTMGIPFARMAERFSRVRLITFAFVIWSAMTALFGTATGFLTLLLTRAGVSVGEAGCGPSAHSLIADRFPPERRSAAVAIFMSGVSLGSLIAAIIGGAVAQSLGWRMTFYVLGATGLICAILFGLTVPEAPRTTDVEETPSFGKALRFFASHRPYHHIALAIGIGATSVICTTQYLTSFFIRTYHLGIRDAALHVALVAGLAGAMGTYAGGILGNLLSRRDPGAPTRVLAWGYIVITPIFIIGFLIPQPAVATILLMAGTAVQSSYHGPAYSALYGSVAPRMRATAAALIYFNTNLIGVGLGSPAIGALSDILGKSLASGSAGRLCALSSWLNPLCSAPRAGGLQLALSILALANLWGAYHFHKIAQHRAQLRDNVDTLT